MTEELNRIIRLLTVIFSKTSFYLLGECRLKLSVSEFCVVLICVYIIMEPSHQGMYVLCIFF